MLILPKPATFSTKKQINKRQGEIQYQTLNINGSHK